MILELVLPILGLAFGIALLTYSSNKAVEHSVCFALEWGLPPLLVGLVFVSLGTDLPEIVNSILSSSLRHGDINIGNSLGSILSQMTLVPGLLPFIASAFKVKRREILILGTFQVLALILAVTIASTGYVATTGALLLVAAWPVFMLLTRRLTSQDEPEDPNETCHPGEPIGEKHQRHIPLAILGFVGVAIGAVVVIESVIFLSEAFSEYLISFFVVGIGTSLPELVVDLAAIRKGQYQLAIGDIIGSCIVDATFALGIGPLIFPVRVSGQLVLLTGLYAILGSVISILILASREKLDRKAGVLLITTYILSFSLLSCCPALT